ncbi:MAG: hypothetical protein U0528_20580 [Anaerolineae bacterium]
MRALLTVGVLLLFFLLLTQAGSAQTDCLLGTPFAPMPVDHAVVCLPS